MRFELRLLYFYIYSGYKSATDIGHFEVLIVKLLHRTCKRLFECGLMRASLRSVLSVDERIIIIARLVDMRKGNLYIVRFEMYDRVKNLVGDVFIEQIFKTFFRNIFFSIVINGQS